MLFAFRFTQTRSAVHETSNSKLSQMLVCQSNPQIQPFRRRQREDATKKRKKEKVEDFSWTPVRKRLDLVDVDILVIVASIAVLVELDVIIDTFVTVAVESREEG